MKANCLLPIKGLFLLAFVFISSLSIFTSCKKNEKDDLTIPLPPSNVLRDSIYLEKVYTLDSISPLRIDTTHLTKFEYDDLKRVVRAFDYDYSVSQHEPVDHQTFFYSGQDVLHYKLQFKSGTVQFNFYTNTGEISSDSIHYVGGGYFVRKYTPITGGYMYETIFPITDRRLHDTSTFMQTIQNGHIVKETRYHRLIPTTNYFYEYDAKPNPLHRLNLHNSPVLFANVQDFRQGVDPNNITKTIYQPAGGQTISNHQYLYNTNGLPHRVYTYYGNQPPTTADSIRIIRYEYTAL